MKYIIEFEMTANKAVLVDADSVEDAMEVAEFICQTETVPVKPEEVVVFNIIDVYEASRYEASEEV